MYEDREIKRKEKQMEAALVIVEQMKEKAKEKLIQKELKEQEGAMHVAKMKELEEKEQKEKMIKMEQNRKLLEETIKENDQQVRNSQHPATINKQSTC